MVPGSHSQDQLRRVARATHEVIMDFTREELVVIHQALCLAALYYEDGDRRIAGMNPRPEQSLVTERLNGINGVLDKISKFSMLLR